MVSGLALVTGATGGLGRSLVPALRAAGSQVRATGRNAAVGAGLDAEFVPLDLRDPLPLELFRGVRAVFHLAALSSPWGRFDDFRSINVDVTRRLLRAAREAGSRRFVHVSSPSIYAEPRPRIGLDEASSPARRFANYYAATKFTGEQLVLGADSPAMRTVVLRPRAIIGPHDRVLLPRLLRLMRTGRVVLPGGGKALVELTDVRDAAAALIAAGDPDSEAGRAFNISGGAPRSVRWLVERVAGTLGMPVRIASLPIPLAMAGAAVLEIAGHLVGREPPFTRYAVTTLGFSQTFDLGAARSALGWAPRFTPEDAIAHALAGRTADA